MKPAPTNAEHCRQLRHRGPVAGGGGDTDGAFHEVDGKSVPAVRLAPAYHPALPPRHVDEVEFLFRQQNRQPRPAGRRASEKYDVALHDGGSGRPRERAQPQQPRDLGGTPQHEHRLGAEHPPQAPAGAGDDGVHLAGRRAEHDVAALDERARVEATGSGERVAQRVLLHAAAAHVDGP